MRRVSYIAIFAIIAAAGIFFSLSGASYADKIVQGVRVGPVPLGGLSRNQAEEKLAALDSHLRKIPVLIKQGEKSWRVEAGLLGVGLDFESTWQKALQVGHTGSFFTQWQERYRVKSHGLVLDPVVKVDRSVLKNKVMAEAGDLIIEPQNAGFTITGDDQVEIIPGRMGRNVNFELLEKRLVESIASGQAAAEIELPLVSTSPQRSLEDIKAMGINGRISAYSTKFDASQEGRTYNIKVAASALDGLLIAPGEEFSFNRVVGPRSSEAGYKNANVIINNELVPGLGGGVCQVSSTLYNAVLLANLKVTDRSNHSLPIGYVPIGRDATVAYDAIDFRFVNNSESYIYIKTIVNGNILTIKLFGNKEKTPRVEINSWVKNQIEPKIVYEKDPNLAYGEQVVKQKGSQGFIAVTERTVWLDGKKITEHLPESHYQAVNRIIAIGTGEVKPSVVVPTDDQLAPVDTEKSEAAVPGNTSPAGNTESPGGTAGTGDINQQGGSPAEPGSGQLDAQPQETSASEHNVTGGSEPQPEAQTIPGETGEIEPETETEL
ncbi:VanW family protein [Desulfotruncus alcoholivorax]|uniref:VanW family protein n=1 Tax=Desulfotruncus alcoholivorax TaxID=265477 RepID=UPI000412C728|nr:VanW family protein [Desulfotruncus alcoholivorax]